VREEEWRDEVIAEELHPVGPCPEFIPIPYQPAMSEIKLL
jgi:hypothetical protein